MKRSNQNFVLLLSLPLSVLVTVASLAGLISPTLYVEETPDWMAQAVAQDAVDLLLLVPILTITSLFVYREERLAAPIWGGALLYLIYTFLIYSFSVHFNALFLVYVTSLGLSVYGFIYFLILQHRQPTIKGLMDQRPAKVIGTYFLVIATLFYFLWLSDVIPATLQGYTPATISSAGLLTNPVHVIDLSIFLPGIFITGILLFKRHPVSIILAPVLLVFFVLMDVTIAVIMIVQFTRLGTSNPVVMVIMPILAVVSGVLLSWMFRKSY